MAEITDPIHIVSSLTSSILYKTIGEGLFGRLTSHTSGLESSSGSNSRPVNLFSIPVSEGISGKSSRILRFCLLALVATQIVAVPGLLGWLRVAGCSLRIRI